VAILAGETITAARLNRLQPVTYRAVSSGVLNGSVTSADIPGLSLPITTETAGARYTALLVVDVDLTGASTALASARLMVDGTALGEFATFGAEVSTDRGTVAQTYEGSFGSAGAHTVKAIATLAANQSINLYSSLLVTVYEVA
jgi:hypothetical protein